MTMLGRGDGDASNVSVMNRPRILIVSSTRETTPVGRTRGSLTLHRRSYDTLPTLHFTRTHEIALVQDRVDYKVLLDANNLRSTCQHGRPGKWAAIVIQDEYNESPYEAYEYIYAPVCACCVSVSCFIHACSANLLVWGAHRMAICYRRSGVP